MKKRHLLQLLGPAILLSACATTSAPDDLGELVYTGFSERSDGTAYHKAMGVSCPAEIDGLPRTSTTVYNDAGTDISCNYSLDDRIFTMYLSKYPKFDLPLIYQDARRAIEYRFAEQGYEYDEALSETCSSESIDTTSIMSGLAGMLSGGSPNKEITISPSPSAVYISGSDMTLVVVDEMFDHEFFKIRYTDGFDGEASVEAACALVRNTYLSIEKSVRADRGMDPVEGNELLEIINAADGN